MTEVLEMPAVSETARRFWNGVHELDGELQEIDALLLTLFRRGHDDVPSARMDAMVRALNHQTMARIALAEAVGHLLSIEAA